MYKEHFWSYEFLQ